MTKTPDNIGSLVHSTELALADLSENMVSMTDNLGQVVGLIGGIAQDIEATAGNFSALVQQYNGYTVGIEAGYQQLAATFIRSEVDEELFGEDYKALLGEVDTVISEAGVESSEGHRFSRTRSQTSKPVEINFRGEPKTVQFTHLEFDRGIFHAPEAEKLKVSFIDSSNEAGSEKAISVANNQFNVFVPDERGDFGLSVADMYYAVAAARSTLELDT